jgi:N-glycosylase/DNA lyase
MPIKQLKKAYKLKKNEIKSRLKEFRDLTKEEQRKEFLFCTLTPQSNAQKCWQAVEQITQLKNPDEEELVNILRTRTRFHNNKARYISQNIKLWNNLQNQLQDSNIKALREWLADNITGYGMKEASHFLRNIGKSGNQIAILDRHILRNLEEYGIIQDAKIRGKNDYLEKEEKYLKFAKEIGIPADELDLLWWSQENGSIFK